MTNNMLFISNIAFSYRFISKELKNNTENNTVYKIVTGVKETYYNKKPIYMRYKANSPMGLRRYRN